jgi:hypothetical protein
MEELEGGSLNIQDAVNTGPEVETLQKELNEIKRKYGIIKTPSMKTTFLQKQIPWLQTHFNIPNDFAMACRVIEQLFNASDINPFLRKEVSGGLGVQSVYIFDGGSC